MNNFENQHGGDALEVDLNPRTLLGVAQIIASNLRALVVIPVAVAIAAYGIALVIPPVYTASTKFLPPQQQQGMAAAMLQSLGSLSVLAGAAAGLKNPNDQFISFLKTRSVLDPMVTRFDLKNRYDIAGQENIRVKLTENTKITSGKDNLIQIDVSDQDPKFAANIANGYVEELERLLNRLTVTEAQKRRLFFEEQLKQSKEALARAEQVLASSGVGGAALNASPGTAVENLAKLRAQLTASEIRIASLRTNLTESSVEVRQASAELGALRNQIARAEREQPSDVGSQNDYIKKFRDYKYQETLYELIARQYEVARIDENRDGSVVQVVDAAVPPEKRSSPKRMLIAVASAVIAELLALAWLLGRANIAFASRNAAYSTQLSALRNSLRRASGMKH